jgi:Domain of unknown function (DUF6471)
MAQTPEELELLPAILGRMNPCALPALRNKRARIVGQIDSLNRQIARLKKHGLEETEASIANKLSRGTFAATFFLATLAALEAEGVRLEDI